MASFSKGLTANQILNLVKTVDGAGSGVDADTIDGVQVQTLQDAIATAQATADGKLGVTGTAVAAIKWATKRIFSVGGDMSGSAEVDGSSNVTLNVDIPEIGDLKRNGYATSLTLGGYDGLYSINVQDGTGRVNHRWNMTSGPKPIFQFDGDHAAELDFDVAVKSDAMFAIRTSTEPAVAGEPVTLADMFVVGDNGIKFKGNSIFHEGNFNPSGYAVFENTPADGNYQALPVYVTSAGATQTIFSKFRLLQSGSIRVRISGMRTTSGAIYVYAYKVNNDIESLICSVSSTYVGSINIPDKTLDLTPDYVGQEIRLKFRSPSGTAFLAGAGLCGSNKVLALGL